ADRVVEREVARVAGRRRADCRRHAAWGQPDRRKLRRVAILDLPLLGIDDAVRMLRRGKLCRLRRQRKDCRHQAQAKMTAHVLRIRTAWWGRNKESRFAGSASAIGFACSAGRRGCRVWEEISSAAPCLRKDPFHARRDSAAYFGAASSVSGPTATVAVRLSG